jgi:translation elongation factor EF-1alpha
MPKVKEPKEELIGKITHYFDKIEVGIIEISKGKLAVGDEIHIKGATTDFEQAVDSMQIEHEQVQTAKKGDAIGLKVKDKVREGDEVYKK